MSDLGRFLDAASGSWRRAQHDHEFVWGCVVEGLEKMGLSGISVTVGTHEASIFMFGHQLEIRQSSAFERSAQLLRESDAEVIDAIVLSSLYEIFRVSSMKEPQVVGTLYLDDRTRLVAGRDLRRLQYVASMPTQPGTSGRDYVYFATAVLGFLAKALEALDYPPSS